MGYLFRGVSEELYRKLGGKLIPKVQAPFEHCFIAGKGIRAGDGAVAGRTTGNAVIRHQLGQAGFPTSGVSTTPYFERALFYATSGGLHTSGYIYKIDRELLTANGVYEFIIAEYATNPSVPEDDEVILVASDYRELPAGIVVEVVSV
jgi:hypothetical protein